LNLKLVLESKKKRWALNTLHPSAYRFIVLISHCDLKGIPKAHLEVVSVCTQVPTDAVTFTDALEVH